MTAYLDHTPALLTPIWLVPQADADGFAQRLPEGLRALAQSWARTSSFRGEPGRVLLIPSVNGGLGCVLLGLGTRASLADVAPYDVAGLPERLPSGAYQFADVLSPKGATTVALGWGLGSYRYERYKSSSGRPPMAQLVFSAGADSAEVRRLVEADALCRDLINTPAVDLTPADLAQAVAKVGALFLKRFVSETTQWAHLDLYAWNPKERAGRAVGAEMQAVRALWQMLRTRYKAL